MCFLQLSQYKLINAYCLMTWFIVKEFKEKLQAVLNVAHSIWRLKDHRILLVKYLNKAGTGYSAVYMFHRCITSPVTSIVLPFTTETILPD